MSEWRPDILGDGFDCLDLDLGVDDEGPLVATLVRALPAPRGIWRRWLGRARALEDVDVLYVHGWSDYFFQRSLARFFTDRGARFFALDLRKYGRSLRPGQTPGYIEDLADYDPEIALALAAMGHPIAVSRVQSALAGDADEGADEAVDGGGAHPDPGSGRAADPAAPARGLVLLGHSTGGLILSLWCDRHRGVADALVLNSPWLELQLSGSIRRALAPMVSLRAKLNPYELAAPQLDLGFYAQAQQQLADPADPMTINPEWRPERTMPIRTGWLRAVLAGHARVSSGIDVGVPACVLLSTRSQFGLSWNDEMLRSDTVLDVDQVARAALRLGPTVTVERIDGALHDVFLSAAPVRAEAYRRLDRWLRGWRAADAPATRGV
ncbi:MAG: alpha/beta hydrolase [Leucobacter sp.]